MIAPYTGHDVPLETGNHVITKAVDSGAIKLRIESDDGDFTQVWLTPDEAVQVATALLRDRNLQVLGHG